MSAEHFEVRYRLQGDDPVAMARTIAVEQTIEFPQDLVTDAFVRDQVIARVVGLEAIQPDVSVATLRYRSHVVGRDLPQLLNVLFGNTSLLPGVRVEGLELSDAMLAGFRGPRFGVVGLRSLAAAPSRPLLCTAVKPMGLPVPDLAELVYRYAMGGMDWIKDDHGLADQPFGRFEDRVVACCAAVRRANRDSDGRCRYAPNISGPADRIVQRARFAKEHGAGGLLVAPGLMGFDTMRAIADDDGIALPILMHPALLGGFLTSPNSGIAHHLLLGVFARLAGADATIFPHSGGRFSFTPQQCGSIGAAAREPLGNLVPILPSPAGGMSLDRVGELRAFYGEDVLFLIGGDLHRHGDITATCRRFRALVTQPV